MNSDKSFAYKFACYTISLIENFHLLFLYFFWCASKSMKSSQLDPLYIPDHYPKTSKLYKLELTQGKLFGLSSIKRVGSILVGFERDAVHMMLNLGITDLKGKNNDKLNLCLSKKFMLILQKFCTCNSI